MTGGATGTSEPTGPVPKNGVVNESEVPTSFRGKKNRDPEVGGPGKLFLVCRGSWYVGHPSFGGGSWYVG